MRYLAAADPAPVWLVGNSAGTASAIHIALNAEAPVAGVILAASVSVRNARRKAVTQSPLETVRLPVLVVHHRDDACPITPAAGARQIIERLTGASRAALRLVSGGEKPAGKPCTGRTPHGFLGTEAMVVESIARFIHASTR